jgi:hypothetical protein
MQRLISMSIRLAMAMTLVNLSGCEQTVNARWTTAHDTEAKWESSLPTLTIIVYGQIPNASNEQIADAITNGVPAARWGIASDVASEIEEKPHIVLSIGTDDPPESDEYCAKPPPNPGNASNVPSTELILTICDGRRLVAWSRARIDRRNTTVAGLVHKAQRLQNLALIGIEYSPSQYTPIEVASSQPYY